MNKVAFLALIGAISAKHLLAQEASDLSAYVDMTEDLNEEHHELVQEDEESQ
jgi:hypothetical protein